MSEAPIPQLEQTLIEEYLRAHGYDRQALSTLSERQRRRLLSDAGVYASGKLTEIEARSHLLHELHDGVPEVPKTDGE
jgi:hypothetical protein